MPTFKTEDFEIDAEGEVELKNAPPTEENDDETTTSEGEDEGSSASSEGGSEASAEQAPAPTRVKISELEIDDSDLPEDLRGKIKTGKDLLAHYESTRNFARDLYSRIGAEPAQPAADPTPPQPLLSEDELGIGADPAKVEEKLNKLVSDRVQPFITTAMQRDSENHARTLLENETEFPYAKRFAKEILTAASRMDLTQTSKPETWRNLYNYIIGANHQTILAEIQRSTPPPAKPKAPASERGDNGSRTSTATKGKDADFEARVKNAKLSPEQKMVADNMGVTEDAFIRQALKMGIELNGKL